MNLFPETQLEAIETLTAAAQLVADLRNKPVYIIHRPRIGLTFRTTRQYKVIETIKPSWESYNDQG